MSVIARRALLRFIAASPVFAGLGPITKALAEEHALASARDALDVFELEEAARKVVPPAHWGYLDERRRWRRHPACERGRLSRAISCARGAWST